MRLGLGLDLSIGARRRPPAGGGGAFSMVAETGIFALTGQAVSLISPVSFGTAGATSAASTSHSLAYPASIAAGDLLVVCVGGKYPPNGPSTPTDFTAPANNQWTGGAGAAGIDSGETFAAVFVKEATGSESGTLTVSVPSANTSSAIMLRFTKRGGSWLYACTGGADTTAGTGWSVTGAADPDICAGDMVVVVAAANGNSFAYSAQAVAATGVTFGAASERMDLANGTGDDCRVVVSTHPATGGRSTAAPVFTMTASGTSGNEPAGASVFLRLRAAA